ncbi:unnamed protein product [Taenia asiatica]|uniref:Myosin motor domain-containing protein n=1 Tax=Taenia asiatica TaxID=60517 RepID=A0A158RA40_TAEAS|nr:unnamed protein product [Taenia asiatica]
MDGKDCWLPDEAHGYILGRVVKIINGIATCRPTSGKGDPFEIPVEDVLFVEPHNHQPDDNCALINLNEATLLENVKQRYLKDKIYTYVANILIAVNPYYEIKGLYSKEMIKTYKGMSLGTLPPHPFAIADKAFRDMKLQKEPQAIIVSGESGAGKTETTKHVLRYLTESYGADAGVIEQRIIDCNYILPLINSEGERLSSNSDDECNRQVNTNETKLLIFAANPLLEAFGNAKTMRNNNSSRFGKFIELAFDKNTAVSGGSLEHYILEKGRLVRQSPEERNFHFFYQLFAGAPNTLRQKLGLTTPDDFLYLSRGCTRYFLQPQNKNALSEDRLSKDQKEQGPLYDIKMDDLEDFKTSLKVMTEMGLDETAQESIFSILAGILHLGNVIFQESLSNHGGCMIAPQSQPSLNMASKLLGLDATVMAKALTTKITGNLDLTVALRVEETSNARDGLAKVIYDRLFDLLVTTINRAIPQSKKFTYIGLLDIAGFEHFDVNSFEQFCINYCNEKLQQFFNERILREEQIVYQREGLNVSSVSYVDNQDCIDLIETKDSGILALLDEESRLPNSNSEHFTDEVHRYHSNNPRITVPRKDKKFKNLRDSEGFLLKHFAGSVCYTTAEFIAKNNDALHHSLEELLHSSSNDLLRKMHNPKETKTWTLKKLQSNVAGKINFISVGSKFKDQINDLITKLRSSGTNFIRCVKPNSNMADHEFEGGPCLLQLRFFGLTDVLMLMQQGFPSRTQFGDLYSAYKPILPQELRRLEPRMFFKALFHAMGMNDDDYKFGVSKVFFRAGKFAEFDEILRMNPDNLSKMVERARKWIVCYRWRRAIYTARSVIRLREKIAYRHRNAITIQRYTRGWLVRKRVKYYIQVNRALQKMSKELADVREAYEHLPLFQGKGFANVDQAMFELRDLEQRIRQSPGSMEQEELRANFERLQANVREVQAEVVEHRRLEEEQKRKERMEKEKEKTKDIDGEPLDTVPLIKLRNVGNLQSAVPNDLVSSPNGNRQVQTNGIGDIYKDGSEGTSTSSLTDVGSNAAMEIFMLRAHDMTFKELKSYMDSASCEFSISPLPLSMMLRAGDESTLHCIEGLQRHQTFVYTDEKWLGWALAPLKDFKDIQRLSTPMKNGLDGRLHQGLFHSNLAVVHTDTCDPHLASHFTPYFCLHFFPLICVDYFLISKCVHLSKNNKMKAEVLEIVEGMRFAIGLNDLMQTVVNFTVKSLPKGSCKITVTMTSRKNNFLSNACMYIVNAMAGVTLTFMTVSVAELHHPHSADVLLQLDAKIPAQIEGVGTLKDGHERSRNYVHLFKALRPLYNTSQRVE